MKKLLYLLSLSLVLLSCRETSEPIDTSDLVGQWQLAEQYFDPGDGSGTFSPIASDKRIEFFDNGIYSSNGQLCTMSPDSDQPSSGIIIPADGKLKSDNCGVNSDRDVLVSYKIEDDFLELSYSCYEGCRQRYKKIE